jgi:hypothetical protein
VKHHAADQLDVVGALAEHALGGLSHRREGRNQQVVELGAIGELRPEFVGAGLKRLVAQRADLFFQRVDRGDPGPVALDAAAGGAQPAIQRARKPVSFNCDACLDARGGAVQRRIAKERMRRRAEFRKRMWGLAPAVPSRHRQLAAAGCRDRLHKPA